MFGLGVGLNDVSIWQRAAGFFSGGTQFNLTTLSAAALISLGVTNSVATTSPPGTVTLSDGTVGYGAHNLAGYSEDISNAAWQLLGDGSKVGTSRVVTWNGQSVTLWRVNVGTAGGTLGSASGMLEVMPGLATSTNYSWQLVAMADSGTVPFRLSAYWGTGVHTGTPDLTATTTPQAFALPWTTTTGGTGHVAVRAATAGGAVGDIWIGAALVNIGAAPCAYVKTPAGSAVYAPRLTCDRGATHNLLAWSEDPTNGTAWNNAVLQFTQTGSHPLGALATKLAESNTTATDHRVSQPVAVTGPAIVSFDACAGERKRINAREDTLTGMAATFDLSTGTVAATAGAAVAWMTPLGSGWYRCYLLLVGLSAGTRLMNFRVMPDTGTLYTDAAYAGTVGYGLQVSRFQVTNGSTPLPYLRTYATAPLYASGTPTGQNLLQNSVSPGWGVPAMVAALGNVGPTGGAAFRVTKQTTGQNEATYLSIAKDVGCVHTTLVAMRAASSGQGSFGFYDGGWENSISAAIVSGPGSVAQAGVYNVTGLSSSQWTVVRVRCVGNASATLNFYPDLTGSSTLGASVDIAELAVYEGTADLPYTETTGSAVSVYPQLGLLTEEGRTNYTNNQLTGASSGTPGTLPTNWSDFNLGSLTRTLTVGTDQGVPCLDIRLNGTTNTTSYSLICPDPGATAANTQTWTAASYIRLQAGSMTNISGISLAIQEYNNGTWLNQNGNTFIPSPVYQRTIHTRTLNQATTNNVKSTLDFSWSSGVAIDITLRIILPTLEQGTSALSPIFTSTTSVSRGADQLVWTNPIGWGNTGTFKGSGIPVKPVLTNNQGILARNGEYAAYLGVDGKLAIFDGVTAIQAATAQTDGISFTVASSWGGSSMGLSVNGATAVTGTYDGTMGTGTVLTVGSLSGGAQHFNGVLTQLSIVGTQATNAQLAQLSAGTLN